MGKTVIKRWEDMPPEGDREDYILSEDDYKLRRDALQKHGQIVNEFASLRMQELMETVLTPILGITDYAIRIEFQNRTAVHFHMLGKLETSVTDEEFKTAMKRYLYVEDQRAHMEPLGLPNLEEELEKYIKDEKKKGVVIVEEGEKDTVKPVVDECRQKAGRFCTFEFGQSIMHPQVDPELWPGPNVPPPSINVLRHPFPGPPELDPERDYEYLCNRVQRHKCTPSYCKRQNPTTGEEYCRFGYPKRISERTGWGDYENPETGQMEWGRVPGTFPEGYKFTEVAASEQCSLVANHGNMVSHVPEILRIWRGIMLFECRSIFPFAQYLYLSGNVDAQIIKDAAQLIDYVNKYVMKPECASQTWQTLVQKVSEGCSETDSVRKAVQKIFLKLTNEHDYSKVNLVVGFTL